MSDPLLVLLLTIGLSLLIGFSGWSLFRNRSSTRYPVRAAGLICLLIGLYVTGISELLLVAVRGLIGWFGAQRWDTHMWIGIGACVLGALAYLIGGRIGVPPRAEEAKPKRIRPRPRPAGDPGARTPTTRRGRGTDLDHSGRHPGQHPGRPGIGDPAQTRPGMTRPESQAAGSQGSNQDPPGSQIVQIVHQPLIPLGGHQRPHRHPALPGQR